MFKEKDWWACKGRWWMEFLLPSPLLHFKIHIHSKIPFETVLHPRRHETLLTAWDRKIDDSICSDHKFIADMKVCFKNSSAVYFGYMLCLIFFLSLACTAVACLFLCHCRSQWLVSKDVTAARWLHSEISCRCFRTVGRGGDVCTLAEQRKLSGGHVDQRNTTPSSPHTKSFEDLFHL